MADTFKKINTEKLSSDDPALVVEDSWKYTKVEKSHQPEIVKSITNYVTLEKQLEDIDLSITSLTKQKEVLEAEMVKVKTAAEAE